MQIHVDFVFADVEVVDKQYQHQCEGPQVGDVDCFTAVSADRKMLSVLFFAEILRHLRPC